MPDFQSPAIHFLVNIYMLTIRTAAITDIPELRTLVFQVWPQTYESMLELMYSEPSLQRQMEEGARFIFVDDDGKSVGYASYQEIEPGIFKLHKLYVLPSQQGKGTGRFMVDYIIEQARQLGGNTLQLQVNRKNKARDFYERIGFTVTGEFDFDIGNGFVMDDYVMEKKIKDER